MLGSSYRIHKALHPDPCMMGDVQHELLKQAAATILLAAHPELLQSCQFPRQSVWSAVPSSLIDHKSWLVIASPFAASLKLQAAFQSA